jgi:hypothetical protein
MSISVDLVAIIIQCGVLIFFLGKFSEKIAQLEKSNQQIVSKLDSMGDKYLSVKDGTRVDFKLDAAWVAIDHIKEQMIPSLKEVIIKTLDEHKNGCEGYHVK